ncbi:uncharacterized protein LOC144092894 [Stigmatopora argus]
MAAVWFLLSLLNAFLLGCFAAGATLTQSQSNALLKGDWSSVSPEFLELLKNLGALKENYAMGLPKKDKSDTGLQNDDPKLKRDDYNVSKVDQNDGVHQSMKNLTMSQVHERAETVNVSRAHHNAVTLQPTSHPNIMTQVHQSDEKSDPSQVGQSGGQKFDMSYQEEKMEDQDSVFNVNV